MPRENKSERIAREAAEQQAAEAALDAFKASIPARMKQIQDDAKTLGMSVDITLEVFGPVLHLQYPYAEGGTFDETVSSMTEQWEFEYIERRIIEFKEEVEAKKQRLQRAKDAWAELSDETKIAIRENIHYLR